MSSCSKLKDINGRLLCLVPGLLIGYSFHSTFLSYFNFAFQNTAFQFLSESTHKSACTYIYAWGIWWGLYLLNDVQSVTSCLRLYKENCCRGCGRRTPGNITVEEPSSMKEATERELHAPIPYVLSCYLRAKRHMGS